MSHAIDTQGAILTVLAVKTGCKKHFLCILWWPNAYVWKTKSVPKYIKTGSWHMPCYSDLRFASSSAVTLQQLVLQYIWCQQTHQWSSCEHHCPLTSSHMHLAPPAALQRSLPQRQSTVLLHVTDRQSQEWIPAGHQCRVCAAWEARCYCLPPPGLTLFKVEQPLCSKHTHLYLLVVHVDACKELKLLELASRGASPKHTGNNTCWIGFTNRK